MYLKGYLYVLAAGVCWGILGPFAKLALNNGLQPMEIAFWRAVLAWIFFGTHAMLTKKIRMKKADIPMTLLFAICAVTLFYGSYQTAIEKGGAALAAVLLYTAPAWVAAVSFLFLKESVTAVKIAALLMTIIGVAGVSFGTSSVVTADAPAGINLPALGYGLAAGFFYALYYIVGGYFIKRGYTAPNLFLYILPLGALGLLPAVSFAHKSPTAWAALICIAFISTYAAYYFYYMGMQILGPLKSSITATVEPVAAAVAAYFWWNECFSVTGYLSCALILGAVVLIVRESKKGLEGSDSE